MKKLCVAGLLILSQFVYASYDKNQVNKLGPHVKEAVNKAFAKNCKPEDLDAMSMTLKIEESKNIPLLTEIVTQDIKSKHALSNNEVIDIWNLSREAIVAARKNKKPEEPSFFIALAEALEQYEASKKMTYGEWRIDRKLQAHKRREAELVWQSNPDKISPATDKALEHCNNAIITSNYQLNPTWQNWALTQGVDGRFLVASAVLIAAGAGAINHGLRYGNSDNYGGEYVVMGGAIGVGLGVGCLSLSLSTDGVKFSAMSE